MQHGRRSRMTKEGSSKPTSARPQIGPKTGVQRREVRQAAARLQALGKVSLALPSQDERLQERLQSLRTEDTYGASGACPDCVALQAQSGDATALCERHLRQALGF